MPLLPCAARLGLCSARGLRAALAPAGSPWKDFFPSGSGWCGRRGGRAAELAKSTWFQSHDATAPFQTKVLYDLYIYLLREKDKFRLCFGDGSWTDGKGPEYPVPNEQRKNPTLVAPRIMCKYALSQRGNICKFQTGKALLKGFGFESTFRNKEETNTNIPSNYKLCYSTSPRVLCDCLTPFNHPWIVEFIGGHGAVVRNLRPT